ncbi:MAG: hypothetical protein CME59_23050 [Halioglobus sp.]|nr:hypothetical protein [Halioglobus sp.]|tara:strand:+ start:383 stop:1525 length:1143 start_codon:yes stop_codon:yes gene_type:complete
MSYDSSAKTPDQGILDGSLWARFCEELKAAGDVVLQAQTPPDLMNRAEGFRYLTRLLRAGLDSYVESSDPRFPRFFQLANETIKIGNDNPDNIYHNANVDGSLDYKLKGNRGTVDYLSFGTKAGSYATTGSMEPTGQLEAADLALDDNGDFEIILSSRPHAGNWLPMREDSESLIVRQTFGDRSRERAATYSIECVSPRADDSIDPAAFAGQLMRSAGFVKNTADLFVQWMDRYSAHINRLPADDQARCQRAGGDSSIYYLQSYWKLAPDEALLIHARDIPKCRTWNFQLSNYWMESLDYRYHRVCVNKHTAAYNSDGSVTVVVAHSDPGDDCPNWLTTAGHDQGGMLWRWVEADAHPPVECRVVKFAELLAELKVEHAR